MLRCESRAEGMAVKALSPPPPPGRGNRSAQYFYCNGRYIKSPLSPVGGGAAYKNSLLTGRYPACVLYLELSFGSVDVNVHPAKTEVKFSAERQVFDLVYHAVLSALGAEDRNANIQLSPAVRQMARPREDFYRSMSARDFREGGFGGKSPACKERSPDPRPRRRRPPQGP